MKLLLVLLVIAAWVGLTTVAAWAMPERQDEKPDLIHDNHWLTRTRFGPDPEEPLDLTGFPPPPTTTTTTTTAKPAPPRPVVPARPPPPPSPPRANGDGCGGWRPLVSTYSWNVDTACRILLCESGGNPNAVGPQTRYGRAQGLMQILPGGSFDPATNMAQAWAKYSARGWQPWVCN